MSNPFHQQKLKVFGKERPKFDSLIFNHNSPLKPMFVQGTQQLIETGVMNYLRDTYEGNFIPVVSDAETMVLKSGQVVLMFAIIFLAFLKPLLSNPKKIKGICKYLHPTPPKH